MQRGANFGRFVRGGAGGEARGPGGDAEGIEEVALRQGSPGLGSGLAGGAGQRAEVDMGGQIGFAGPGQDVLAPMPS